MLFGAAAEYRRAEQVVFTTNELQAFHDTRCI